GRPPPRRGRLPPAPAGRPRRAPRGRPRGAPRRTIARILPAGSTVARGDGPHPVAHAQTLEHRVEAHVKAVSYRGPSDLRVVEKPDPHIEHPNDVILRVTVAAVCGSDLHLYRG